MAREADRATSSVFLDRNLGERSTGVKPVAAVVAPSAAELETFFGVDDRNRLAALLPSPVYYDPDTAVPGAWSALLEAVPEVLVSAWRTSALPAVGLGVSKLRYVCHLTGSVRGVVPRSLVTKGLAITNWGDIAGPLVAEHALLLILGALRAAAQWPAFMATDFTREKQSFDSIAAGPSCCHPWARPNRTRAYPPVAPI